MILWWYQIRNGFFFLFSCTSHLKHRPGFFFFPFILCLGTQESFSRHESCSSNPHPQSGYMKWYEAGESEQRDAFVGETMLRFWLLGDSSYTRLIGSWSGPSNNWLLCPLAPPFSFSAWLNLFTPLRRDGVCPHWCYSVSKTYRMQKRSRTQRK